MEPALNQTQRTGRLVFESPAECFTNAGAAQAPSPLSRAHQLTNVISQGWIGSNNYGRAYCPVHGASVDLVGHKGPTCPN